MGNKTPLIRIILFVIMVVFLALAAYAWFNMNNAIWTNILAFPVWIAGFIQLILYLVDFARWLRLKHALKSATQGLYKSWRKHSSWKNILIVALVFLLLVSVGFNAEQWSSAHASTPGCSVPICITQITYDDTVMYPGINDGSKIPFFNQFDQMPDAHSTDGTEAQLTEAQLELDIYKANHDIVGHYITLLLVTTLSRSVNDPIASLTGGINDLRGAYLAQKYYNNTNPAFKLRLLIANLGTKDAAVTTAPDLVKQIEQLSNDKTFVGVVGFPFSKSALPALKPSNSFKDHTIPVVSPSASSDDLSSIHNFYRIVAPDQEQSKVLHAFIISRLQTLLKSSQCTAVFIDDSDTHSHTLGYGFLDSSNLNKIKEPFKGGDTARLVSATNDVVANGCGMIFFAGFPDDLNVVKDTLKAKKEQGTLKHNILIVGGGALYNLGGYTSDNYHNLLFEANATYAYPNPKAEDQNFKKEYMQTFDPENQYPDKYGPHLPEVQAVLAFDAIQTFLHALANTQKNNTGNTQPALKDLTDGLPNVSFNGVSGFISLYHENDPSHKSDPVNKNIYIACTDNAGLTHIISTYQFDNKQPGNEQPTEIGGSFHPNALTECRK